MAHGILHTLDELAAARLVPAVTPELRAVAEQFSIAITPAMVELIDPDDPSDPIAAQFVPTPAEQLVAPTELADPIGDERHSPLKGLVHRYPDRVLLKPLHACAVYCRFCFRREQVGAGGEVMTADELRAALDYIRGHEEIWEVILSGGDPLLLSDRRLAEIVDALNGIEHVKVIRFHTRIPVVAPEKITDELVAILHGPKPIYVLLHCNHASELTDGARKACARLVDAGIPMLSQSVLLRGVNDSVEALRDLMRAFVEIRVKPHYLHHPDLARGTGHFRVPLDEGQELMRGLRGHLSGLCQPSYILDIPGGNGKVPVGPVYAHESDGAWHVRNHMDELFDLPPGF